MKNSTIRQCHIYFNVNILHILQLRITPHILLLRSEATGGLQLSKNYTAIQKQVAWNKNTWLISVLILVYSLTSENHCCQIKWFANHCSLAVKISIHSMLIYLFYLWRITNEDNKSRCLAYGNRWVTFKNSSDDNKENKVYSYMLY